MLHKPTSMLYNEHADKVLLVLDKHTKKGGVFGILSPPHPLPGHSPREYRIGSAAPTVIFTVKQGGALAQIVTCMVECRSKVTDCGAQKQACGVKHASISLFQSIGGLPPHPILRFDDEAYTTTT